MQWMVVGHMLVIGIVLPFASILMKWFSVRKLTLFSLVMLLLGSLIDGFAMGFPMLLIGRMVQSFGPGLLLPIMFAMVIEVFPKEKIGFAMGMCSLIIMFAPAIRPTIAGLIIGTLGWRWIFFTFSAILCAAVIFAVRFLVSPYELTKPVIDVYSIFMSAFSEGSCSAH